MYMIIMQVQKSYLPQKRYTEDEMRVVIKMTFGERNEQRNHASDI